MEYNFYDLAYFAGYLDGDGCFFLGKTIQRQKNIVVYEYCLQIVSVKREVLDKFSTIFGGHVRQKQKRLNHKIPYAWALKGKKACTICALILEMLVDKKIACDCLIEMSKTISQRYWKEKDQILIDKRENIIKRIKKDRDMNGFVTKESIESLNNSKKTIQPIPRDYAYLAGLIDSEGCFRVKTWKPKKRPNKVYAICLEIGNTKLPIMPWLIKRFGGSIVFVAAKPNKKAAAIWSISANSLYEILPMIYPFLMNKKAVCEKLIEFQKTILPNGGDRHSELFNALFAKNRANRDRIVDEIHALNAKGDHN
jgi:hypothetical protein